MADEVERSAASVEEAIEAALDELGVSEQEATVRILQEPNPAGTLPAIVRVRLKSAAATPPIPQEVLEEQGEAAADFLEELLSLMGIEADIEPNLEHGTMYVDIFGTGGNDDDMALLIGRFGQTLQSIQDLTRAVVSTQSEERPRIVVDVEDYKKRQRSRLERDAKDLALRVAREGGEEELEPMNAYDRKIVHDVVAETPGVESFSRGEGPDRHVVIRAV
ncbi:MAG: RNA-binding cell elongation regulator Jag/EloR [Actinomycetota bacterium]